MQARPRSQAAQDACRCRWLALQEVDLQKNRPEDETLTYQGLKQEKDVTMVCPYEDAGPCRIALSLSRAATGKHAVGTICAGLRVDKDSAAAAKDCPALAARRRLIGGLAWTAGLPWHNLRMPKP